MPVEFEQPRITASYGAIALAYAARYPDRVSKLVLIDSQVLGLSAECRYAKNPPKQSH